MSVLPDELWVEILHSGVRSGKLKHRDLCALAIVSARLNRFCELDIVWKELLAQEFPEPAGAGAANDASLHGRVSDGAKAGWKRLYKLRYEKVKREKIGAHHRQVLRETASLNMLQAEIHKLRRRIRYEEAVLFSSQKELVKLDRSSRTAVALQIWQPHAVSTQHEQVLQQMPVDLAARKNNLRIKVQDCKTCIRCLENSLNVCNSAIERKRRELDVLKYNPLQELPGKRDHLVKKGGKKRKALDLPLLTCNSTLELPD